ncbi:MAG TPA: DsrE family protein [Ignavibacteriaceae bacterium]|nr:DsrE family protein [Ignavibacteriaceae bacterium]
MKILFIINDAPYGTEKAYNGLRMAMAMQKQYPENEINIFLMADAVTCALPDQNTPQGYYNIERMLKAVLNNGGKVKACGTCSEARGVKNLQLIDGTEISNMVELTKLTIDADKVLTF